MVHHISHIVHTAQTHIVLAGNDGSELPLHLFFHNGNGLRGYPVHPGHAFHSLDPFVVRQLLQHLGRLHGIHVSKNQCNHLRPLILQQGEQRLGVALGKEIEGLRLQGLGHLLQKVPCRGLAKCLFQNVPGIIQSAVSHHLMGQAQFVKFVQHCLYLGVAGLPQLRHLVGKVFNILFI